LVGGPRVDLGARAAEDDDKRPTHPPALPVLVCHVDDALLALDNRGHATHPQPRASGGHLASALVARYPASAPASDRRSAPKAGVAHRLDIDTSA